MEIVSCDKVDTRNNTARFYFTIYSPHILKSYDCAIEIFNQEVLSTWCTCASWTYTLGVSKNCRHIKKALKYLKDKGYIKDVI